MVRMHARAAAIAAVWSALVALPAPAAAQHEGHGVPAGGAQVVLTGTASCAEGTPSSGAVVRLFHGSGPGRHLVADPCVVSLLREEYHVAYHPPHSVPRCVSSFSP